MSMNRLLVKGGYGEHGRSCFLLPMEEDRYCMLDCGIMDTDPQPYPKVEPEILKRTDYLYLSHCHKDHSGAFEHFCRQGFYGWLVTTAPTMKFSGIDYDKTILLPDPKGGMTEPVTLKGGLSFFYGRTGHCAGSIWLHLFGAAGNVCYSGDYQRRALAYETDLIQGRQAQLAILDCAHVDAMEDGDGLRARMTERIREILTEGRRVIMPLPKYGRGLEVVLMLRRGLPGARLRADETMKNLIRETLKWEQWVKPEAAGELRDFLDRSSTDENGYDVLLIGDTHLEKPENSQLALQETEAGAVALLTGRVKKGCCTERLLQEGKAFTMAYPHHQSRKDFLEMVGENRFQTVLPFHNNRTEVLWGGNPGEMS